MNAARKKTILKGILNRDVHTGSDGILKTVSGSRSGLILKTGSDTKHPDPDLDYIFLSILTKYRSLLII